jgi:hypothetical protein
MLKRLLLCLALSTASIPALAVDYTDIWYTPSEPGWGVNIVQSDTFIFATFFIYGQDGSPTWYSAQLNWDGASKYTGGLYATKGTWFASAWVPGNSTNTQVGTASFTPSDADAFDATLDYTVTGTGSVTKAIQRQTLTSIRLGGEYTGGQTGTYTSCSVSSNNGSYAYVYDLTVTQQNNGNVTFNFRYDGGIPCTFSGTLHQTGQLYFVPQASYTCTDGFSTTASMSEIKATGQGIEGRFSASDVGGRCRENAQFSAVLQ